MLLSPFLELLGDIVRAGLNVDEPKGTAVPGRELLPMELEQRQVIPRRGRHRRSSVPTSLVPDKVARIAEKDRSSLPLWPGGAR